MQPTSNSRTEKAIRNEIHQTGQRIADLCEEIDDLRADCYRYRDEGENCNLEDTKKRIEYRVRKLMKAINRMNKLGRELSDLINEGKICLPQPKEG